MGQNAPFLNGPFSPGDRFQDLHPALQALKGPHAEKIGGLPAVLGDDNGGRAVPQTPDDLRGAALEIGDKLGLHK